MWSGLAWLVMHINANESWQRGSGCGRPRQRRALYRKVHGRKRCCHVSVKDAPLKSEHVSTVHNAGIVGKKGIKLKIIHRHRDDHKRNTLQRLPVAIFKQINVLIVNVVLCARVCAIVRQKCLILLQFLSQGLLMPLITSY